MPPDQLLVTVDPVAYVDSDTCKANYPNMSARIADIANIRVLSDEEFSEGCAHGHGFGYIYCGGRRRNQDWLAAHALALDFDDTLPLQDFQLRCRSNQIHPAFVYATLSHGIRGERYRAVFILSEPVVDCQLWKAGMLALAEIFPESDNCYEAARFFAGGKSLLDQRPGQRTNLIDLIDKGVYHAYERDASNHAKFVKDFAKRTGLVFSGRNLKVLTAATIAATTEEATEFIPITNSTNSQNVACGDLRNRAICIIHNSCEARGFVNVLITPRVNISADCQYVVSSVRLEEARKRVLAGENSVSATPTVEKLPETELRTLPPGWITDFGNHCQLFKEYATGERRLSHNQRFGFAHNLSEIKGFEKLFLDAMSNDLYTSESKRKWRFDYRKIRDRAHGGPRVTCEFMQCPHIETCDRHGYASCTAHLPRRKGQIRRIHPEPPRTPLLESRRQLAETWQSVYGTDNTLIHLILVDTGVGKTHTMLNTALQNCIVAAPTHQLKNQLAGDYRHGEYFLWPDLPPLPPSYLEAIEDQFARGAGGAVDVILRFMEQSNDDDAITACQTYLEALRRVHDAPLVICTHEKAFRCHNEIARTIIFDEDPLNSILRQAQIRAQDIAGLAEWLARSDDPQLQGLADRLRVFQDAAPGIFSVPTRTNQRLLYQIASMSDFPRLSSPAHLLLVADAAVKRDNGSIACIEVRRPPENKKIIILSASANVLIYQKLFGERLKLHDLRGTEIQGRIFQHSEQSYSKTYLQSVGLTESVRSIRAAAEHHNLEGIITYKMLEEDRNGTTMLRGTDIPVFAHFGAQYGLNEFQGRCIGVFGVPHRNDEAYKLMAKAVGLDTSGIMRSQTIEPNGFEFECWTYDNPDLRELQLSIIDGEYAQAIGRARLVTHATDVHVFSNYPVSGAALTDQVEILDSSDPTLN